MDSSDRFSALTRPRVAVAVVSTVAVVTISYYVYLQQQQDAFSTAGDSRTRLPDSVGGSSALHRSNAVRRTPSHRRRNSRSPSPSSSASHTGPAGGGGGGGGGGPDENNGVAPVADAAATGPPEQVAAVAAVVAAGEADPAPFALLDPNHPETMRPLADGETVVEDDGGGGGVIAGGGNGDAGGGAGGAGGATTAAVDAAAVGGDPAGGGAPTEDDWEPSYLPVQRAGQNIVSLLFRVSEDNARRNAYVHRGCACNACGTVPIRGIRYRCANCADFDLCETCESQGLHYKTHIFYKVRVPAPPFGPRQMQPVWYPGDPESFSRSLPRSLMAKLSRETGFERPELEAFWEQWTFMANTEWREDPDDLNLAMDRKTFERCLAPSGGYRHAAPNLIHDRMFSFYDTNSDDLIGFTEFLHGLSYRKRKDKLRKIFEGYDIDADGYVNRRDFLRMFRAYYVLYKQMHRDILEGLDDQVMSSTEAQQLVTNRQPLSGLFGREGRVPSADTRAVEGKAMRPDGDMELTDDKAQVVVEDKSDTATREQILSMLLMPRNILTGRYAGSLLDPPITIDEMGLHVSGARLAMDDGLLPDVEGASPVDEDSDGASDAGNSNEENQGVNGADDEEDLTAPSSSNAAAVAAAAAARARNGTFQERADRAALRMDRQLVRQARRQLHDRWKRRHFYLDEEEGGMPPEDWEGNEDILVNLNGVAESSKTAAAAGHLSPRSRSSSKVRFAEETDDYDVRSNPSTSSRSVPERWGGMDLPDAERDAGKEILYQVTQQAFNELLDTIFKSKENLAVRAAETKSLRDRHRHLFESLDPDAEEPKPGEDSGISSPPTGQPLDGSLEALLSASGYTVDIAKDGPAEGDKEEEAAPEESNVEDEAQEVTPAADEHRDPTMPQFRPNTAEDALSQASSSEPQLTPDSASVADKMQDGKKAAAAGKEKAPSPPSPPPSPPSRILLDWKRLDLAEEEAKVRGGWGKLSFTEFEEIYKSEENQGNRLDYLGSWIDFCIP